jgi:RNA polymerase sigma factor (sigma-70 family)
VIFSASGFFEMREQKEKKAYQSGGEEELDVQGRVEIASTLFQEYNDVIRAIIEFNISDKSRVDDIYQNFFLAIVNKSIPSNIKNIKGYIYRAITNDIIDMARRTKSYRARIERYAEYQKRNVIDDNSPENIVIQAEERQKMIEIIEKQLPSREAEAVLKRYDDNISIDNAAKEMRVKKRTFSRYLCLGLKKIQQILNEEESK